MKKSALIFALIIGLLTSASTLQAQTVNMSRYITLTVKKDSAIKLDFWAAAEATPIRIVSGSTTCDFIVGPSWIGYYTYTAGSTTMTIYGDINGFVCSGNGANLTALDLSHNTQLIGLYCSNNTISSLDVSKNTQLMYFDCGSNELTSLDVSKNTQLTQLSCYSNRLTTLDVSQNTQLEKLYCQGNNFTTAVLDRIYCALPARISSDGATIFPLDESSSAAEQNMVASTNAANATAKKWKVLKYKGDGNHTDIATTGSYVCSGGSTTSYDLKIAGVTVTSANCSDLSVIDSVSGTVKYDPATKVLTLENATIQTNTDHVIISNIDGLTIKVIGTNNLTTGVNSALVFINPLTITGGGVLNANSENMFAIYAFRTNLTIDGCTVNAKGKRVISGYLGLSEMLTIKNSTVTAEGSDYGSIVCFAGLTLDGCAITQPVGAAFDASLKAVALGGAKVTSKVVISPTEPNMSRYITLNVKKDSVIKLDFKSAAAGTPVRIVSGSTTQNITVGTNWYGTAPYIADGNTMTVYGDITDFDCQYNGANISALDLSHNTLLMWLYCQNNGLSSLDVSNNTQLTELYCFSNNLSSLDVSNNTQLQKLICHGNKFSAQALDDIYCALPDRTSKYSGAIKPVFNSSSSYNDTVLATNAQNAIAKNWKVQYYDDNTDIPATTGTYVCSAPEPNMNSYITLTVTDGAAIKLDFMADADGTPVRIVSGSNTQDITVGTNWTGTSTYTADGTTMTVYGDITMFECSDNYANLTALKVSHNTLLEMLNCINNKLSYLDISKNTKLKILYCNGNDFTTAALDDIYCSLPDRTSETNGVIQPVYNSSSSYNDTVLATNAQNAIAKNWKVQYYDDGNDIPATTGSYVCPATDIADATAEPSLTLYPNPVADVLYLSATARTIRVYNIYGIEVAHATDTNRIDVANLPAGIYTVKADGTVAKMVKR